MFGITDSPGSQHESYMKHIFNLWVEITVYFYCTRESVKQHALILYINPHNTHTHTHTHTKVNMCAKACTYAHNPLLKHTGCTPLLQNKHWQLSLPLSPPPPPPLLHSPPLTLPHSWGCGRGSPCQPCAAPLPSPSPAFAPGPPSGTPAGRAAPRPRQRDTERGGRKQDGLVPLLGQAPKRGPTEMWRAPVVCWQRPVPAAEEAMVQLRLAG